MILVRIWSVAVLTYKEGIRDRALHGIGLLALFMLLATLLATQLFGYDIGKVTVDLTLSTIGLAGLLMTFFININLIAKDIDKRTIYCVLSKPISRSQYVLGKYIGLALLITVSLTCLIAFSSVVAYLCKASYAEAYFKDFSWTCYYQACGYELLMLLLLNGFVLFYSSITSSSFLTMLFAVSTYIVGQTIEEIVVFFQKEAETIGFSSPLIQHTVETFQYILPNLSAFDIKTMASHGKLMTMSHTVFLVGYSVAYTALLLYMAILIFKRREFN
ncbi:MAG: ABC transporter permease [Desulfobulbaceae bacterium]|nr:ABC transporter permease [Desulfobulbaceae bacterium]